MAPTQSRLRLRFRLRYGPTASRIQIAQLPREFTRLAVAWVACVTAISRLACSTTMWSFATLAAFVESPAQIVADEERLRTSRRLRGWSMARMSFGGLVTLEAGFRRVRQTPDWEMSPAPIGSKIMSVEVTDKLFKKQGRSTRDGHLASDGKQPVVF